jgi:hypothetical protein
MQKHFVVKLWNGHRMDITMDASENYNNFIEKLQQKLELPEDKTFKFISKGKTINANNFDTLESESLILALLCAKPVNNENTNSRNTSQDSNEPMYSYKNIKAAIVVFFEFVHNNPQLSDLYRRDHAQLMTEFIKNSDIDMILRNILKQSNQILSAMEKGSDIEVNINPNNDSDKIKLTKEDEHNIDELIRMGFDAPLVVKTYVENGNNKDLTLEKLLL